MFPRVGAHGDSESSKKNNRNSLSRFDMFLHAKGMKEFSDLEPQELNIELLQEFAGYLCEAAEKVDGESFAWETISKFITGVKMNCMKDPRFKDLSMWKDDEWYAKIRGGAFRLVLLRCIREGKPLSSKSTPVMRTTLRELCRACLLCGDFDTYRFIFVSSFMTAGRTAELRDASWDTGWWDPDDRIPNIMWNERKVAKQSIMNFFCDYEFYESDWFHALGCYWMSGGGSSAYMALHLKQNAVETPVCPDLARLESASVQSYINDGIREVYAAAHSYNEALGFNAFDLPQG